MLKQQLQQKLQQKLSPAQIQVIKMLEIPTLELEERIRQELEENPALEEGIDFSDHPMSEMDNQEYDDANYDSDLDLGDYKNEDDIPEYKLIANNTSRDDKHEDIPFSVGITFHEYLIDQVGLLHLDEKQKKLVEYIIGNIDEEGYLRRDAESMVDDIVFQVGVETSDEEMKRLIKKVQQLDPPGVGATDLQECLMLQLERKGATPIILNARKIISEYFDEFSKKHYDKIIRSMSLTEDELKDILNEITRLNPKPGSAWGGSALEKTFSIIIPDFVVENDEGTLTVQLNNANVPELRINNTYNEMFEDYTANKANQTREMRDAVTFVKQKIDAARWFIDAIKQRQQTLMTTMTAIVNFQREYFLEGDETFLKPMVLKDIADITGYDISTISRVSNSKYVQTEFGVYPVKYFFSEAMTNESGEEISTREIKKVMQEIIDDEDKKNPLNDDKLVEALKGRGYVIARRTAAKYREQLNIPVARLRREI
ncbi:MAG TPA: RNA polymerase factor sigma-54 [Bacteroidales bacterium]|nr:RNA polymerase factor sigma-54 [Bacteroidales bacterium]